MVLEQWASIDEMYRVYCEKKQYPGYAYGIVWEGELIHSGSGGYLDIEKKIPATPSSLFRIASMTKSFTAMGILKLRDEGKLRLDDPIDLYIPEMRGQNLIEDSTPITIRDLLIHIAGFPTDDPWADRKLGESVEELISLIKGGLSFSNPSGMLFEYSNLGYALLGVLIQKIAGISYQDYIDSTICHPFGIKAYWEYKKIPEGRVARRAPSSRWDIWRHGRIDRLC